MIGTNKKRHRALEVANPDLGGAGVEVERAFFRDLGCGARSEKDFDANRRSVRKERCWISDQPPFLSAAEQDNIGDSDLTIASKDGLLDCGQLAGVKVVQAVGNGASSLAMIEARRRRNNELPGRVDLKAFRPIGKSGIVANVKPAPGGWSIGQRGHGMACGNSGQSEEVET